MFSLAAIAFVAQLAVRPPEIGGSELRHEAQYRPYGHPPPCGHGFDLDARDGFCYPNGMMADAGNSPQDQSAARSRGRRGIATSIALAVAMRTSATS
jgi:hypothetical protein